MICSDVLASLEEKKRKKIHKALAKLGKALEIKDGTVVDFSTTFKPEGDGVYVHQISVSVLGDYFMVDWKDGNLRAVRQA